MTFFQHTSLFLTLTSEGKIIDQIFQFYETVVHDPIIELSLSSPHLCKVGSGELRPHFTAASQSELPPHFRGQVLRLKPPLAHFAKF